MNQYYLLAQLPSFNVNDEKTPLPVTEEYFYELCSRFLDNKKMTILRNLSLEPPRVKKPAGSAFVDAWYDSERSLRLALAQIRALRMKKKFDAGNESFSPETVQVARTAVGMDSPLSAEMYLNQYRLNLLDNIRPSDSFSVDAVFCYGLKLKMASRIRKFNADKGTKAYRKIYERILGADASGEIK